MRKSIAIFTILLLFTMNILALPAQKKGAGKNVTSKTPVVTNLQDLLRSRTEQFLKARKTRNGLVARTFYNPEDIKAMHETLRVMYVSVKEDIAKGVFPAQYIKRSIEESSFGEAYKKALLKYLLQNGDFQKEMDSAFTHFLVEYPYTITKFEITKLVVAPDGKSAEATVVEHRKEEGQSEEISRSYGYHWQLKHNTWYLRMEGPAHI